MRGPVRNRLAGRDPESGVYAVLYAALVIVLIAFAAIVVDLSAVRQDRRLNRSAADSAALGGALMLDWTSATGSDPHAACLRAWDYLSTTLRISTPAAACGAFVGINATSYCATASPAEIDDDRTVGARTVRVAWPIPNSGGTGFLNPDLSPGSAGVQAANGKTDGQPSQHGCDRLGVAVWQEQQFGLASAFGATSTRTQDHSVALLTPQQGNPADAAALNVLNPRECEDLVTTGGGKVTVGPSLYNDGTVAGPGIIAVESTATSGCSGSDAAIDPTTGKGSRICAAAALISATSCDGLGFIFSHALDPGGNAARAYNTAAVPSNLTPMPTAERVAHGWTPVTGLYGCNSLPGGCSPPPTNYIQLLVTAYGGNASPGAKHYSASVAPYSDLYPGAFDSPASLCPGGSGITTVVVLAAGNHYANCDLVIKGGGALIDQGGTLVVKGQVSIAAGGCLVMNTLVTTCPTGVLNTGLVTVTTPVPPLSDSILYIQGNGCPTSSCFDNSGDLVLPQTFVYMGGTSPLNVSSTGLTLWTAPGAGPRDLNGLSTLERACGATATADPDPDCMASRFAKMTFWSEYAAPSSKGHQFAGQGNLNVIGIFFTPTAYFNLTGGGGYTGAGAQFWADKLNVNGGANLGLSPYRAFSQPPFGPDIGLIR